MRRLTLHSFSATISPKTEHISFHNHYIRLILLCVISCYSPNSKDHSEDTVLNDPRDASRIEEGLKAIPEIDFNKCFDNWKKRWRKCIRPGGGYFEGDEIDLDK